MWEVYIFGGVKETTPEAKRPYTNKGFLDQKAPVGALCRSNLR